MNSHELDGLSALLRRHPWFVKKDWPIQDIAVLDHCVIPSVPDDFLITLVDVHYAFGTPERFVLPFVLRGVRSLSPLQEQAFAVALMNFILEEKTISSARGSLCGRKWTDEPHAAHDSWRIKRCPRAQTNSSFVFNEQLILKTLSRVEAGVCPELEVGQVLLRHHFQPAPPLIGSLSFEGSAPCTVALVHQYVPQAVDGWEFVSRRARTLSTPGTDFLSEIKHMGGTLGTLHLCLAQELEAAAFVPQPILREDLQRWSASLIGELGVALSEAENTLPELAEVGPPLIERIKKLFDWDPSGLKIRIHGDLHLSQLLWAQNHWWLVDFEGEPDRTFEQRRALHSPLKDVAGMKRSFDYVFAHSNPKVMSPWLSEVQNAFLEGFYETVRHSELLPVGELAQKHLTKALEIEKCVYELRYELHHRPGWVNIPAQALMREAES